MARNHLSKLPIEHDSHDALKLLPKLHQFCFVITLISAKESLLPLTEHRTQGNDQISLYVAFAYIMERVQGIQVGQLSDMLWSE